MKRLILFMILILFFIDSISALTIKIGSIAPARSPWDKALREMSREWKRISNGKIRVKIYPGGIAGSEKAMIRKMKIGILGGAVLTNRGITSIYPDFYVLGIPLLIQSEAELNYVTDRMNPYFAKKIEEKGYKVLIWSMAGWVQFFSKRKMIYPKDLKKHKLSFTTGEPEMEQAWKRNGYQVIPNELKDMMMALQSGMITAFYLPPLVAASGQYFALAPNMLELKVAPLYGGIVVSNRIWNRIPDNIKDQLLEAGRKISSKLSVQIKELEKKAVNTMIENGLKINNVNPEIKNEWFGESIKSTNYLVGKAFSKDIYDEVKKYLDEFRKKKTDK